MSMISQASGNWVPHPLSVELSSDENLYTTVPTAEVEGFYRSVGRLHPEDIHGRRSYLTSDWIDRATMLRDIAANALAPDGVRRPRVDAYWKALKQTSNDLGGYPRDLSLEVCAHHSGHTSEISQGLALNHGFFGSSKGVIDLESTKLNRITWQGLTTSCTTVKHSIWDQVTFDNCIFEHVNFVNVDLQSVRFSNVVLRHVNFRNVTISNTSFTGVRLENTSWSETSLKQVDMLDVLYPHHEWKKVTLDSVSVSYWINAESSTAEVNLAHSHICGEPGSSRLGNWFKGVELLASSERTSRLPSTPAFALAKTLPPLPPARLSDAKFANHLSEERQKLKAILEAPRYVPHILGLPQTVRTMIYDHIFPKGPLVIGDYRETFLPHNRKLSTWYEAIYDDDETENTTYFVRLPNTALKDVRLDILLVNKTMYGEASRAFYSIAVHFVGSPMSALSFLHDHTQHLSVFKSILLNYRHDDELLMDVPNLPECSCAPKVRMGDWRRLNNIFTHYCWGINSVELVVDSAYWARVPWDEDSVQYIFQHPYYSARDREDERKKDRSFLEHVARVYGAWNNFRLRIRGADTPTKLRHQRELEYYMKACMKTRDHPDSHRKCDCSHTELKNACISKWYGEGDGRRGSNRGVRSRRSIYYDDLSDDAW